MDYYELLKWHQETGLDNQVVPEEIIEEEENNLVRGSLISLNIELKKRK